MSDRTEAPTPRRLEEAREEGRVPRSIELNSAVILLIGPYLLLGPGKTLFSWIREYLSQTIVHISNQELTGIGIRDLVFEASLGLFPRLVYFLSSFIDRAFVTFVQTKFLWSTKRKKFDFERINPFIRV
jgi:flagellar biosynthesis protein FlhB